MVARVVFCQKIDRGGEWSIVSVVSCDARVGVDGWVHLGG